MKGYWKILLEKYNNLKEDGPAQIIIHNPQNITINNSPNGDSSISNASLDQNNVQQPYNDETEEFPFPVREPNDPTPLNPISTDQLKAAAQNYVPGMEDPNFNPNEQQYNDEPIDSGPVPVDPNSYMQMATFDTLSKFQAPDGTPFANPDGSPLDFERQKYEDEDYPNDDDLPSPEKPDGNAPYNPDNQVQNTLPYQDEEPQTTESLTTEVIPQQNMNSLQQDTSIQDPNC